MSADDLRGLARAAAPTPCPSCAALSGAGWESVPGSFERSRLRCIGTLRDPLVDEPTLDEHHPAGTHAWSPDAPIAPAFYPYNRCEVRECVSCARVFLCYTEYQGYYQDERIRALCPGLVVDVAPD